MSKTDFGILGLGLAGASLAHELMERGYSVTFADIGRPGAASPVAPGLVNPLAGRKLKPDERLPDWMAALERARKAWERTYSMRFWNPVPMVRLLENAAQAQRLESISADPALGRWVAQRFAPGSHGTAIADEYGSFLTAQSGWLDIPALVSAVRQDHRLREVAIGELPRRADRLIDCRGWRAAGDRRWSHLPWNCVRGEMLTIDIGVQLPTRIWNRGTWLQPIAGGCWRLGATYAWDEDAFAAPPTATAASQLTKRLGGWLRAPIRVLGQSAGVRAVLKDYRPVIGPAPDDSRWHLFSGLGSKGSLLAPSYARALADFLDLGTPLPPEASPERF